MIRGNKWFAEAATYLTVLAALWPLEGLVHSHEILLDLFISGTVVSLVGLISRRFAESTLRSSLGLVGGLAAGVLVIIAVCLHGGYSLSSASVNEISHQAQQAVSTSVAPLPGNVGVLAMVIVAATVIAVVVDYVGGTSRMPYLAAIPVAAPFVLVSTALGRPLAIKYFVFAACAWALLALVTPRLENARRAGMQNGGGRGVLFGSPRAGGGMDGGHPSSDGARRSLPTLIFAVMTIIAVIAGLLLPKVIPHRKTPALSTSGNAGVNTSVDFSQSLDLHKDLTSRNSDPVLQYNTDATTPAPLRVTTSSTYSDGIWRAETSLGPFLTERPQHSLPALGLSNEVKTVPQRLSVTINGLHAPLIATASSLTAINFANKISTFRMNSRSGIPLVPVAPPAYSILYKQFTDQSRPTSNNRVTSATATVTDKDLSTEMLGSDARGLVNNVVTSAHATTGDHFKDAVALQNYFRQPGRFTYSLTLAATQHRNGHALDPLSNFLVTKQGYCTQFATAMIMAARSIGIPARVAIGFLPGEQQKSNYVVRANDAHAWPELYFPGMGWTRFDPTPTSRSGSAPPYAPDAESKSSSRPSTTSSSAPSSSSSSTISPTTPTSTSSTVSLRSPAPKKSHSSSLGAVLKTLAEILGTLLLIAALLSIVPLAGRAERGRLLKTAGNDRERNEGHWHDMVWSLRDLGLKVDAGGSPRATMTHFTEHNPGASSSVVDALGRAATAVEGVRYGREETRSISSASRRTRNAARADASRGWRLRAVLLPASGLHYLRTRLTALKPGKRTR